MGRRRKYIPLLYNECDYAINKLVNKYVIRLLQDSNLVTDDVLDASKYLFGILQGIDTTKLEWYRICLNDFDVVCPYTTTESILELKDIQIEGFSAIKNIRLFLIDFKNIVDAKTYSPSMGLGFCECDNGGMLHITLPCINKIPIRGNVLTCFTNVLSVLKDDNFFVDENINRAKNIAYKRLLEGIEDDNEYIIANLLYRLEKKYADNRMFLFPLNIVNCFDYVCLLEDVSLLNTSECIKEFTLLRCNFVRKYLIEPERYREILKIYNLSEELFKNFITKQMNYIESMLSFKLKNYITLSNKGIITTEKTKELNKWQNVAL